MTMTAMTVALPEPSPQDGEFPPYDLVDIAFRMPDLAVSAEMADRLALRLGDVRGKKIGVACATMIGWNRAFTDRLLLRLLVERGALTLDLVFLHPDFRPLMEESAAALGVSDRVDCAAGVGRIVPRDPS